MIVATASSFLHGHWELKAWKTYLKRVGLGGYQVGGGPDRESDPEHGYSLPHTHTHSLTHTHPHTLTLAHTHIGSPEDPLQQARVNLKLNTLDLPFSTGLVVALVYCTRVEYMPGCPLPPLSNPIQHPLKPPSSLSKLVARLHAATHTICT